MNPYVLTLKRWYRAYIHALVYLQPAFLLIVRLLIGWGFILAGSGKLQHPDVAAKQFAEFGVPMPAVNVYIAGAAETVCGLLLMLGAALVDTAMGNFVLPRMALDDSPIQDALEDVWIDVKAEPGQFASLRRAPGARSPHPRTTARRRAAGS